MQLESGTAGPKSAASNEADSGAAQPNSAVSLGTDSETDSFAVAGYYSHIAEPNSAPAGTKADCPSAAARCRSLHSSSPVPAPWQCHQTTTTLHREADRATGNSPRRHSPHIHCCTRAMPRRNCLDSEPSARLVTARTDTQDYWVPTESPSSSSCRQS